MELVVYSIETLYNCFTYVDYNVYTREYHQFVIHKDRNEVADFIEYLKKEYFVMVGYNNLEFAYPIIHYIIKNAESMKIQDGTTNANDIYNLSQSIIESTEKTSIPYNERFIKQLDLYKIWGFNSRSKSTSLNDLKFNLRMKEVYSITNYSKYIVEKDIPLVLKYNKNSVDTILKLLKESYGKSDSLIYAGKNKIKYRNKMKEEFNVFCENYSDSKLAESVFISMYSDLTSIPTIDLYKKRTVRDKIKLYECIPPSLSYMKSTEFQKYVDDLTDGVIELPNENTFKSSIIYNGMMFQLGLGGVHYSTEPGVYKSNEDYAIINYDIISAYPSWVRYLKIAPEHLDKNKFLIAYTHFVKTRIDEINKTDSDIELVENYKNIINNIIGRTNSYESCLYDQLFYYKIIIAMQLFMLKWIEELTSNKTVKILSINTDEITVRVPTEDIAFIKSVAHNMCFDFNLTFRERFYDIFVFKDVNNYLARELNPSIIIDKGLFELNKEYHKDSSMRIIPLALREYFMNGVLVEDTVRNNKDIYNFLIKLKLNSSQRGVFTYSKDGDILYQNLEKITRYYASNNGGGISTHNGDRQTLVNKGYNCTIANCIEDDKFDINYRYYEAKINSIIESVSLKQQNLFD